jgi:hypothetical protein
MTTEPVLRIYQANIEHVVQTDASDQILGGVLLQREDDGLLHPIMYASRKCLDREMRYDIQNKEMTAIVWCCRRFFKYLYGSHFTIQTDCAALAILNAKPSNNARVARMIFIWAERMIFLVEGMQDEGWLTGEVLLFANC